MPKKQIYILPALLLAFVMLNVPVSGKTNVALPAVRVMVDMAAEALVTARVPKPFNPGGRATAPVGWAAAKLGATSSPRSAISAARMIIFIPIFIFLFIVVPLLLAKMAADLLGLRSWRLKLLLLIGITVANWQMWQAPKEPQVVAAAAPRQAP